MRLGAWTRLAVGAALVAVPVWRLGTGAFLDGLRAVGAAEVAAALGVGLLTTVASAWRWRLVARGLGLRLPLRAAVADYYAALLLNAVLPAGVLGDVRRAVEHGRASGDLGRGVRAVVLERVAGQAVLVAAGLLVLVAGGPVPLPGAGVNAVLLGGGALLAAAGAFLWVTTLPRVRRACATLGRDVRGGLLARGVWPGVTGLSAVALAGYVALFLVAARAAGVTAPAGRLVPLAVLALLVMALPVNVGGWGPREAASAAAFGTAGLGAAQGLTVAVVYGVLALVASLPGLAVLLARRLPEDRQVLPERFDQARQQVPALGGRAQ
ncbi:lysylphosphatidylglycerol synthase transmembrane domain-containing protein [Actinomadura kijaniata]|uniref:lysylphosphatidylglycerol synthase transmembrane domain-containing protein n=1 Tax=Actinomadura kijaniata TaxID=46161 RepID=UPI003F1A5D13